jgi:hypothetical protein
MCNPVTYHVLLTHDGLGRELGENYIYSKIEQHNLLS